MILYCITILKLLFDCTIGSKKLLIFYSAQGSEMNVIFSHSRPLQFSYFPIWIETTHHNRRKTSTVQRRDNLNLPGD